MSAAASCPLCGASGCRPWARYEVFDQQLFRCDDCGFFFVHPHDPFIPGVTDDESPDEFEFWSNERAHDAYQRWRRAENRRIGDAILGAGPAGRLLEIGFGEGPLTELLLPETDEYWGIEPVPSTHAKTVASLGLDTQRARCIRAEDLDGDAALGALNDYFDTVVMVSVFEHLSRPLDILASCHRLLRPGGRLIISVPDSTAFSLLHRLRRIAGLPPWSEFHISFFSKRNMADAFERSGFGVERRTSHRLITPDSADYYGAYAGSRLIAWGMRAFSASRLDLLLGVTTLLFVATKTAASAPSEPAA